MKQERTLRVRSVLLAAIAAISLIAFGCAPRSSSAAAAPTPSAPAASAKALAHPDIQVVTRSAVTAGAEHQVPLPGVGLAAAALIFAFAGRLLLRRVRRPRRSGWYHPGTAPARAPPLAA